MKMNRCQVAPVLALMISVFAQAQSGSYTTSGNHILDPSGQIYYIHGVDRSSYEVTSTGDGHFTQTDFNNMAAWKANTVRIALNQDFLLSDSSCFDSGYMGRLDAAVTAANNAGLNVIFDLHWNDAGQAGTCAHAQQFMADTRSITFWQLMANHFKTHQKVFFELYNEPNSISWQCWLNGCSPWVGMQQLYDTVRNAGFNNLVIIGGLNWAFDLSGVPANRVRGVDIVYNTHPYDFGGKQAADWPAAFGFLTATDPVIATEFGDFNCTTGYVTTLLNYMDAPSGDASRRMSWTGWAWNSPGSCGFPSVIQDFNGTPSVMGQPEHDRLATYTQGGTQPPPAPTNLTATAGNAQVTLSWSASARATSYNVERSTTSGGPYVTVHSGVTGTSQTDTGLTNGTRYFYVVSANDSGGSSPNSSEVSATPMGTASYSLSATPGSATVTAGNSASYTVTETGINGFNGTVALSASGLPSGASAVFSPASISGSGTSALTVSTSASVTPGNYTVTITGASGGSSHSTQVVLAVQGHTGSAVDQINAGGPAVAPFAGDADFTGGVTATHANTINTAGVVNAAPAAVYQTERYGNGASFTYTLPSLTPGASYTVRLHFAEVYFTAAGQREFNVDINGSRVLTNFDIFATAGAMNKAVVEQFPATADGSGHIAILFSLGAVNNPKVSGIEVITATAPPPASAQINAGGSAVAPYSADTEFTGGVTATTSSAMDTTGVVNPAPAAVYQSERYGNAASFTYTLAGLNPGTAYTVRLHFAEIFFTAAKLRQFNVDINNTRVLTNFDVFATAGAMNKAVVEQFPATADGSGRITILFSVGAANNPKISGIEVH